MCEGKIYKVDFSLLTLKTTRLIRYQRSVGQNFPALPHRYCLRLPLPPPVLQAFDDLQFLWIENCELQKLGSFIS